jgi:hypothetical protein
VSCVMMRRAAVVGNYESGHIVCIAWLGVTHKVCRRKVNEREWVYKTCCRLNEPHSFVMELTRVDKLLEPYAFAKGNVMPILKSIPTHILPLGIKQECIDFSAELMQRIEREKVRKDRTPPLLCLCSRKGIRENCERCDPPTKKARKK